MLPPPLRRVFSEHRLLVRVTHEQLCLVDPDNPAAEETCRSIFPINETERISSSREAKQRCDLLLDESLVLVRELDLPLDAEDNLHRVLSFSMDRYTPFTESDVLFNYKIIRRDAVNKKISLTLYVVPRDRVEPAIYALAGLGIEPITVDIASASASGRENIDLCPPEWRSGTGGVGGIDRVLTLSAMVLLLIVVALPFVQRQQTVAQLKSELADLQVRVHQAEIARHNLRERIERMGHIQQQTGAMPAVLDVLLELTRLMPDESWAGQVTIKSGRVRLSGEASAASELLAQLSQSSIFSDPRFEAPLTQNPKTGHERFVISLAIRSSGNAP